MKGRGSHDGFFVLSADSSPPLSREQLHEPRGVFMGDHVIAVDDVSTDVEERGGAGHAATRWAARACFAIRS